MKKLNKSTTIKKKGDDKMNDSTKNELPMEIQQHPLYRMNLLKGDKEKYITLSAYFDKTNRIVYNFYADIDLGESPKKNIDKFIKTIPEHIKKLNWNLIKQFSRINRQQTEELVSKIDMYFSDNQASFGKLDLLDEIQIIAAKILWRFPIPWDWYENGIAHIAFYKRRAHLFKNYSKQLSSPHKELGNQSSHHTSFFRMDPKYIDSSETKKRIVYAYAEDIKLELENFTIIPKRASKKYKEFHLHVKEHLFIPLTSLFNEECPDKFFTGEAIEYRGQRSNKDKEEDYLDNECVIIPVYDMYINGVGYGGIQGSYGFFSKSAEKPLDVANVFNEVKEQLPHIVDMSNYISLSNFFRIKPKEFEGDSLIDYFIKAIKYIQDWETIWVSKKELLRIEETKDTDITHWWGRKPDKEKVRYGWINHFDENKNELKNAVKELKEAVSVDRHYFFELPLKDIGTLFNGEKEEDIIEKYNIDLKQYIIFEFPKTSIIPPESKGPINKIEKEFSYRIKEKQRQVFRIAIEQWKDNRKVREIEKLRDKNIMTEGYIEQMSHNLHHVLRGAKERTLSNLPKETLARLMKEMLYDKLPEGELSKLSEEELSERLKNETSLVLDPNKFELQDSFLVGDHNFFEYLRSRILFFKSIKMHYKEMGSCVSEEITKVIRKFNHQLIIRKYITRNTKAKYNGNSIRIKNVEVTLLYDEEFKDLKVYEEPLYIFLEHYIRNVAKHEKIISEAMNVYVKIEDINDSNNVSVSLWDDNEKMSIAMNLLRKGYAYDKIYNKTGLSKAKIKCLEEENGRKKDIVLELAEFYERWKKLNDCHEKVKEEGLFSDKEDNRGISAMRCLANSLASSGNAELSVRPVLVVDNGQSRYEITENDGKYYEKDSRKELANKRTNRFSLEYQFKMTKLEK